MKKFEKDYIDFTVEMNKTMGQDFLSAQLCAMLSLEPKEVAMDDLAKRTGYSLASVSNRLKKMSMHGLVVRVKKPGTKKVYYRMEQDIGLVMDQMLKQLHENSIKPSLEKLPGLINNANSQKLTQNEEIKLQMLKNKLRQMQKAQKFIEKMRTSMKEAL